MSIEWSAISRQMLTLVGLGITSSGRVGQQRHAGAECWTHLELAVINTHNDEYNRRASKGEALRSGEEAQHILPSTQLRASFAVSVFRSTDIHLSSLTVTRKPLHTSTGIHCLFQSWPVPNATPSHIKRVVGYARVSDWLYGAGFGTIAPAAMLLMERVSPTNVGKGGFASTMRLAGGVGITAGFLLAYSRSISTFNPPREWFRKIPQEGRTSSTASMGYLHKRREKKTGRRITDNPSKHPG